MTFPRVGHCYPDATSGVPGAPRTDRIRPGHPNCEVSTFDASKLSPDAATRLVLLHLLHPSDGRGGAPLEAATNQASTGNISSRGAPHWCGTTAPIWGWGPICRRGTALAIRRGPTRMAMVQVMSPQDSKSPQVSQPPHNQPDLRLLSISRLSTSHVPAIVVKNPS